MLLWLDTPLVSCIPAPVIQADQLEEDDTEDLDDEDADEMDDDADDDEEEDDDDDEEAEEGDEEDEEEDDGKDATAAWPSGILGFRSPLRAIAPLAFHAIRDRS